MAVVALVPFCVHPACSKKAETPAMDPEYVGDVGPFFLGRNVHYSSNQRMVKINQHWASGANMCWGDSIPG